MTMPNTPVPAAGDGLPFSPGQIVQTTSGSVFRVRRLVTDLLEVEPIERRHGDWLRYFPPGALRLAVGISWEEVERSGLPFSHFVKVLPAQPYKVGETFTFKRRRYRVVDQWITWSLDEPPPNHHFGIRAIPLANLSAEPLLFRMPTPDPVYVDRGPASIPTDIPQLTEAA